MFKNILFVATVFSFIAVSSPSFAGDSVSYSAKKQGRVPFNNEDKADDVAMGDDDAAANVSDIEPAAGAEEASESDEKKSVAEDIKLPRKN